MHRDRERERPQDVKTSFAHARSHALIATGLVLHYPFLYFGHTVLYIAE